MFNYGKGLLPSQARLSFLITIGVSTLVNNWAVHLRPTCQKLSGLQHRSKYSSNSKILHCTILQFAADCSYYNANNILPTYWHNKSLQVSVLSAMLLWPTAPSLLHGPQYDEHGTLIDAIDILIRANLSTWLKVESYADAKKEYSFVMLRLN